MKEINLGNGGVALVDDDDYERVSSRNWRREHGKGKYTEYAVSSHPYTRIHRVIINAKPGEIVDHINHDGLDNRKCNLRLCTHGQNRANSIRKYGKTSKYKNVNFDPRCDRWQVVVKGKHIGMFGEELSAAKAANAAMLDIYGDFAQPTPISEARP